MRQSNHGGSEVYTVVLTDAVLPPITFSYSLKAAAAMFADAAATLPEPFGKPLPLGMGMDRKQPVLRLDVVPTKTVLHC